MNTTSTAKSTKSTSPARIVVAVATVALASILAGVFAPQAGASAARRPVLTASQTAAKNALNADRKAQGRRILVTQADAQAKAQAWANKLAAEGRIYHSNLKAGINTRWCGLGENVGYGPTVKSIQNAYMHSTIHRTNILDTRWNGVGVGVATSANGTVYTVQFFITTC